jgi:translation initiation factor 5
LRRAEQERENEGAELDAAEEKRKKKEEKRLKKLAEQSSQNESSDKEKKKKKKKSKGDDDDGDVEWATDTSAAAAKARAEEQLTGNAAEMVTVSKELKTQLSLTETKEEEEEDEESESESEEEDERITKLRAYAAKVNDVDQTLEFLNNKLGVGSDELKVYFLIEAILDDEKPVPLQLKKKKAFISKFVGDDEKKQRGLLNAFELYATETNTDAYKIFAAVLNALYELDLCEEKYIRAWFEELRSAKKFGVDEKTAKAVRKQAASFIEFLDEESDDDDDDDDDSGDDDSE